MKSYHICNSSAYCKVPITKMAREFPVTLIYAASVFQVFVSVVLVSKHFAASFTCVALSCCKIYSYYLHVNKQMGNSCFKLDKLKMVDCK